MGAEVSGPVELMISPEADLNVDIIASAHAHWLGLFARAKDSTSPLCLDLRSTRKVDGAGLQLILALFRSCQQDRVALILKISEKTLELLVQSGCSDYLHGKDVTLEVDS